MGYTAVGDVEHPEPGILCGKFIADHTGTVGGAVVDKQTFKVPEGLPHHLLQQAGKVS
jgi:hypothetical protein